MEENELETTLVESTENNDSQNVEEVESTNVESDTPTLEDYESLQKKNKELFERAKKAEALAKEAKSKPLNKPNETQSFTRDEALLIAQGHTIEEVDLALNLSKVKGVPIGEAVKDEYFTFKVKERKDAERSERASLGASSHSGIKTNKPIEKMDNSEHKALFEKALNG